MLRKLIENWLDSVSERSYQPVFCQLLMAQGYTVLHSTRHCPIEYGKDVLAIAPDGIACAYQLKGNPGSRLTLAQYRGIAPQLFELVNQGIEHPQIPNDRPHRSYLVTNGQIEEEVQQAIVQQNATNVRDGFSDRKLETISRDQLLEWAFNLEYSLWPDELGDVKLLLEILTQSGNDLFPLDKSHTLLSKALKLSEDDKQCSDAEFSRRVSSAALLTAVALKSFSEQQNHWAIISAWTMLLTYLIAAAEKHKKSENMISETLLLAEETIFNELFSLVKEVLDTNGFLIEGNELADFAVYKWRYTLIVGLCSVFWLWAEKEDLWPDEDFKNRLLDFIPDNQDGMDLWGEVAMPQYLSHIWQVLSKGDEKLSASLTKILTERSVKESLPVVYHDAEEIIRHRLSQTLKYFNSTIDKPPEELSWFAQQLMLHMAYRDLKESCIELWPQYTRIVSVSFIPREPWQYCLYRTEFGDNISYVPPVTGEWPKLKSDAAKPASDLVPDSLLKRPVLLWLWCLLCPQRALSPVICHAFSCFLERKATA